ncbi:MAG: SDR family oxidoreductase [Roseiflexus sp.]|jgi:UDP-glucose 4-epimerase|nr:SDR family oxidoreductase [Roseiflexus sp.]MBO9333536.1 SDR family oxidoreductase [Roseiflexus sp.]MBO9363334.1 SDR family oxidoreductase [Roseiflexus sp.]MBO9381008.1 SDR family oxidoreductase [Roseiflexus sp.]MBO9387871.1 SDR family oxidoreductase [Roseiflexus sp.]
MAHVLVTGGAGFIGSHLVEALLRRGDRVRVFDNFSTGRYENVKHLHNDIELIEGDLRDFDAVRRAVASVEVVFHQAALASVQRSVDDPMTTNAVNVTGTLHVLVAARDAGVRRVVFASSSSVYGDTPTLPKVETQVLQPLSPYAVSKLAGEQYCMAFSVVYGLPSIALRYFNVFGPRQDPHSEYAAVIPRFIDRMVRGLPPIIYGDGLQSRDFTYIENVVDANLAAADAPASCSTVFNVGAGERTSLLDLAAQINRVLGSHLIPEHHPPRAGDVRHSLASIEAISQALGYAPRITLAEGLARTIEWFRSRYQG